MVKTATCAVLGINLESIAVICANLGHSEGIPITPTLITLYIYPLHPRQGAVWLCPWPRLIAFASSLPSLVAKVCNDKRHCGQQVFVTRTWFMKCSFARFTNVYCPHVGLLRPKYSTHIVSKERGNTHIMSLRNPGFLFLSQLELFLQLLFGCIHMVVVLDERVRGCSA